MVRITEKSKTGLWHLRGVSWEQLRTGHKITKTVSEKIYGALCKLKDYEDSGMNPDRQRKRPKRIRRRNRRKCWIGTELRLTSAKTADVMYLRLRTTARTAAKD